MTYGRYYPTCTTLPDGQVLTTTGWRWSQVRAIGGWDGSNVRNDIHAAIGLNRNTATANMVVVDNPVPIPARRGHSAIIYGVYSWVFGGANASGDTLNNDVWRFAYGPEELGNWGVPYGTNPDLNYGKPKGRSRHTAIFDPNDNSMTILGGLSKNTGADEALNEVWKLYLSDQHPDYKRWKRIFPSGSGPGPLYGHTAVYDSSGHRMIVFGGTNGTTYSDKTWSLSLTGTPTWSELTVSSQRPTAREGHAAVIDVGLGRLVVFGGGRSDSLFAQLWTLDLASGTWRVVGASAGPPSARRYHTAVRDEHWNRMLVYGGDTDLSFSGSSGLVDDVWELSLDFPQSGPAPWTQRFASVGSGGRALHAAVFDPQHLHARVPERFNPSSNSWDTLSTAARVQRLYPFMFVLPSGSRPYSGKTFFAGQSDSTFYINAQAAQPTWTYLATSSFLGGSAVMYRPGKILKCGGGTGEAGNNKGAIINLDGSLASPTWVENLNTQMPGNPGERLEHNLTILPNGSALLTGGIRVFGDTTTAVRTPYVWDSTQEKWLTALPALADDPGIRDYHSTALLLPDGRIFSAGGWHTLYALKTATIFYPPYLFNSSGNLATRPTVLGTPDTVRWGRRFSICTPQPSTITSACLIRPAAVTHAFNQSQSYVPLTISQGCGKPTGDSVLVLNSPADSTYAQPGDYLLFVVDNLGVPSIAKWIRVVSPGGQDDCDAIRPAKITDLAVLGSAKNSVCLSWTATGDDSLCSVAFEFDLRYSTSTITDANWNSASQASGEPLPGSNGTPHSMDVTGLDSCKTYYFAIKAKDDRPNSSGWNNSVSGSTKCSPPYSYCNEGGGLLAQGGGSGWTAENSLFWESPSDAAVDLYEFKGSAGPIDGEYSARVLKVGTGRADLDQVSLGTVDHDSGVTTFASSDRAFLGTTSAVQSVTDGSGTNVASQVSGSSDQPYSATAGQTLLVTLGGASSSTGLVVESSGYTSGVAADSTGILVQAQRSDGTWRTLAHIHPRRTPDSYAVDAEGSGVLRLVFLHDHQIRSLRRLSISGTQTPQSLALARAVHSRLGDVSAAVGSSGGTSTTLVPGDALELGFTTTTVPSGRVRNLFLQAKGAYTTQTASRAGEVTLAGPTYEFALAPARPNPSSGSVNFSFTMAQQGPVSIRVYDVAGRLVRTLINGPAEPGPHDLVWNATDDGGRRVGAGVYFYRMVAGSWQSQRKVVFINR